MIIGLFRIKNSFFEYFSYILQTILVHRIY